MASLQQTFESDIREQVDDWLSRREKSPRTYGPSGVLAYSLAQSLVNSIKLARKRGFIHGACGFRDNLHWTIEDIEQAALDFAEGGEE